MMHEESWQVIRVTGRGGMAHVELGHRADTTAAYGPSFVIEIVGAPKVGDTVRVSYSWGDEGRDDPTLELYRGHFVQLLDDGKWYVFNAVTARFHGKFDTKEQAKSQINLVIMGHDGP